MSDWKYFFESGSRRIAMSESQEYFFESGFVKLSWDDVFKIMPDAQCVVVDSDGAIYACNARDPKPLIYSGYWGLSGKRSLMIHNAHTEFPNWMDLIFYPPQQPPADIPAEVWDAIHLLFGEKFSYIVMSPTGQAYVSDAELKTNYDTGEWDMWNLAGVHVVWIPELKFYCDDWKTSLRVYRPRQ